MDIKKVDISKVIMNPNNPRVIRDDKFKKLVKSIQDFPEMLDIRPIVVDENDIVLGGNMRLKACQSAGLKEVPIIKVSQLTEEQKKEFIVKDNVGFGEWDWEMLNNDWDKKLLVDYGFEDYNLEPTDEEREKFGKNLGNSDENNSNIDVNDYIKQNIIFLNEYMIEFEDDGIKECIRNLSGISSQKQFIEDLKKLIEQYGKNSI